MGAVLEAAEKKLNIEKVLALDLITIETLKIAMKETPQMLLEV